MHRFPLANWQKRRYFDIKLRRVQIVLACLSIEKIHKHGNSAKNKRGANMWNVTLTKTSITVSDEL
jgi:hypothetical protein